MSDQIVYYRQSAADHFRECWPRCTHVTLCADCADVEGLCRVHKQDPKGAFTWKHPGPAPRPPRES